MALTAIPLSQELKQKFQETAAVTPSVGTRFLVARIQEEKLNLISTKRGTSSLKDDFDSIKKELEAGNTLDQAAYILFHSQGSKFGWVVITYLPDNCETKVKMLYSSTKERLKSELGSDHFSEEYLADGADDLTYAAYDSSKKPLDARSEFEKRHEEIIKEEEQVRDQRAEEITSHASGGSGGYHSVSIPITADAKEQIAKLKSGEANFTALTINPDNQSQITASPAKTVTSINTALHTTEPRFYLYKPPTGSAVLIYCCPDNSPRKLRMVYSTAKPGVISQIESLLPLASRKVETSDPAEVNEKFLSDEVSSHKASPRLTGLTGGLKPSQGSALKTTPFGAQVRANNSPKASQQQDQHPIYGLMADKGPATGKKKIVIPPRAAWNG